MIQYTSEFYSPEFLSFRSSVSEHLRAHKSLISQHACCRLFGLPRALGREYPSQIPTPLIVLKKRYPVMPLKTCATAIRFDIF